jgi:hypothetical protein
VDRSLRVKRNANPSRTRMMPAARAHQGVAAFPAALAGVEVPVDVGARAVATVAGEVRCGVDRMVDVEVVGALGVVGVVDVACCPADALVAVKVNLPLTGCPSREVARQSTLYRPAGEAGCRRWVMVLPTKTALPL